MSIPTAMPIPCSLDNPVFTVFFSWNTIIQSTVQYQVQSPHFVTYLNLTRSPKTSHSMLVYIVLFPDFPQVETARCSELNFLSHGVTVCILLVNVMVAFYIKDCTW